MDVPIHSITDVERAKITYPALDDSESRIDQNVIGNSATRTIGITRPGGDLPSFWIIVRLLSPDCSSMWLSLANRSGSRLMNFDSAPKLVPDMFSTGRGEHVQLARLPGPSHSSGFHFGVRSLSFQLLLRALREGGAHVVRAATPL
jgi:hypothetical protein